MKPASRKSGRGTRRSATATLALAARADTPGRLLAFQRALKDALIRPLASGDHTQKTWRDGRPMTEFADQFIKANDRLSALDRLQIYNRMYWFRLFDAFHDDNPGLRAMLGPRRFTKLAEAYLALHPSSSFTLRNLCSRLASFVRANPSWTAPWTNLAIDVTRFEWAQTVAFDEATRPAISPEEIAMTPPAKLTLMLQPYLTLLALEHPVDDYVIAVKKRDAHRGAASNALSGLRRERPDRRIALPRRERVYLAVHRMENRLYYKRLDAAAYRVLVALRENKSLPRALAAGGRHVAAAQVQEWFSTWMQLGWLCRR